MDDFNGYLLVDKPAGISSFGVVAKIRWIIKEATGGKLKIGHCGTLDPAATGLLILVMGKWTKRAGEFSKLDKTYEVELVLGKLSSTGDQEGKIVAQSHKKPPKEQVSVVLKSFLGESDQTPPAYSAVKVGGQRAYKLARNGQAIELKSRKITIYDIKDIKYKYPNVWFITRVSSGTYIRSLAVDIGDRLGTGAYLSKLKRRSIGDFNVKEAITLENINLGSIQKNLRLLT